MAVSLSIDKLSKNFASRKVIKNLSLNVDAPGSLGVTGCNGSGKTTLMKIIAHLINASRGKVSIEDSGNTVKREDFLNYVKMVGPEISLYEMLTGYENLRFFAIVAGMRLTKAEQETLLQRVGLSGRGDDLVGAYSSGMKQRLKYAVALLTKPAILILDEPTANLDEAGKLIVEEIMKEQKQRGILLVATNESDDLEHVERVVHLDD